MTGQLCYSKNQTDKLAYCKRTGDDNGKLIYKKYSEPIGDIRIEIFCTPDTWICNEYDCEHDITARITYAIQGTVSDNVIIITPTPNLEGTFTVYVSTHCASTERPSVDIKIIATQQGVNPIHKSDTVIADQTTSNYTLRLDANGKLLSIN